MTHYWGGWRRTGNGKSKSWLGEGVHSHPCHDETVTWMGHPSGCGWFRKGKWRGNHKNEIKGSLHGGGKCAAFGREDVFYGGQERIRTKAVGGVGAWGGSKVAVGGGGTGGLCC